MKMTFRIAAALVASSFAAAAPATSLHNARNVRLVGGQVYFTAYDDKTGYELYVADAALLSAGRVIDLVPGAESSYGTAVGTLGTRLLVETVEAGGAYLWSIDPQRGSRTRLAMLGYGSLQAPKTHPVGPVGSRNVFTVNDGNTNSDTLWASDGTPAGTVPVLDHVGKTCALSGRVLAVRWNAGGGVSIWYTDGTTAGSSLAFTPTAAVYWAQVAQAGDYCYFALPRSIDGSSGWELWRSNGTPNGSNLLAQIADGRPLAIGVSGTTAYVLDGTAQQTRLWRSDRAQPVSTQEGYAADAMMQVAGNRVAYTSPFAYGNSTRNGLFVSDGTAAGTQRIGGVLGPVDAPYCLRTLGSRLLALDWYGRWSIDPLSAGWRLSPMSDLLICDSVERGGVLAGADGSQAWRSDDTDAGTRAIEEKTDRLYAASFDP
ncbi:MAG TPA: hypothetical protein VN153_11000 [Tahibacter sp.]|nr:hypothetical protein [Tahibacter sp.]